MNNDDEQDFFLLQAQTHFLSSQSMTKFDKLEELKQILRVGGEEMQMKFIAMTFELDDVKKYPVKIAFQKSFIKNLMDDLENSHCEMTERFFELYCALLEKEKSKEKRAQYHHFKICNEEIKEIKKIIIKCDENFLSGGTTGLSLWQAGFSLAEWALENKQRLYGKNVLELGSGSGFTGLVIAAECKAQSVTLTDGHGKVLQQLVENIKLNCGETKEDGLYHSELLRAKFGTTNLSVVNFLWENPSYAEIETPDLILAADVVYDPSVLKHLSKTLLLLLSKKEGSEAILVCTLRNESTLEGLFNVLGNQVSISIEKPAVNKYFAYEAQFPILIYKLTLNK
ncbi:protein-lysine N-methyltransferase EEF2KMT [Neocloeon triangulifer]|uniref:protein-lysine N-methyltransferase EEF2KMT n=1 Tax=Neocloeon triangulifer TaxID=2078957 RepID=UPI00286ED099|nr:protein-lysine N-methyltransferase EEF2KMT [Neocloeon triangulifer]